MRTPTRRPRYAARSALPRLSTTHARLHRLALAIERMIGLRNSAETSLRQESHGLLQRLGRVTVPVGKQIGVVHAEVDPSRAGVVAAVIQHHRAGRPARTAVAIESLQQRNPPGLVVANHAGGGPARERLLSLATALAPWT